AILIHITCDLLVSVSHVTMQDMSNRPRNILFFFFNDAAAPAIYTLSLHDALPIFDPNDPLNEVITDIKLAPRNAHGMVEYNMDRSEEHTSELQSRFDLVCRLLLEKKNYERVTLPITFVEAAVNFATGVYCSIERER